MTFAIEKFMSFLAQTVLEYKSKHDETKVQEIFADRFNHNRELVQLILNRINNNKSLLLNNLKPFFCNF